MVVVVVVVGLMSMIGSLSFNQAYPPTLLLLLVEIQSPVEMALSTTVEIMMLFRKRSNP